MHRHGLRGVGWAAAASACQSASLYQWLHPHYTLLTLHSHAALMHLACTQIKHTTCELSSFCCKFFKQKFAVSFCCPPAAFNLPTEGHTRADTEGHTRVTVTPLCLVPQVSNRSDTGETQADTQTHRHTVRNSARTDQQQQQQHNRSAAAAQWAVQGA